MLHLLHTFLQDLFLNKNYLQTDAKPWQYFFGVLLFTIGGIKLYAGLPTAMDIQFADEAAYLRFGLELFDKINYNWGPMYAVWYKFLSIFTQDTIALYYLNFALVSILLVVLLYVFLLRINVHPALALLISFSVLVSNLNVSVWPRISHFCVVLCLMAFILISFLKNNLYKCLVFTIACLINAYARPEFYLAFVLMVGVSISCLYFNRLTIARKDYVLIGISVLCLILLHFIFRFPSNDFFGYNRGVAAFYQHYAWNYKMRTHGSFDAWLIWEDLAKQKFGDCNSILCVIKTQPIEFFSNTLFNVRTYLLQLLKVFTFIVPVDIIHWKKLQLLVLCISVLSFFVLLFIRKIRAFMLGNLARNKFNLLLLLCFIFPTVISCIIVFPRDHYLFLQMLFFLVVFVSLISFFFRNYIIHPATFIIVGILLLLAVPNVKSYSFMKVNTNTNSLCNKELIHHLEKNYSNTKHCLFTNLPFVNGMLPNSFSEVNTIFDKKKNRPFSHYLDSAKIDMVIVLPSLLRDPHVSSDSSWNYFLHNYEKFGFQKDVYSDCELYLLTKTTPKN